MGSIMGELDQQLLDLIFRVGLNILALAGVIFLWHNKNADRQNFSFTLGLFNLITFMICFVLSKVSMEMGFALGLFAVFGILRYRTETVPAKAISYLFISIGLSLMNSLSNHLISWVEVLLANAIILLAMYVFEQYSKSSQTHLMVLDELTLLELNDKEQLEYLSQKTFAKEAKAFEIEEIDHVRNTIRISVTIKRS
jgi:hypothetical protein